MHEGALTEGLLSRILVEGPDLRIGNLTQNETQVQIQDLGQGGPAVF